MDSTEFLRQHVTVQAAVAGSSSTMGDEGLPYTVVAPDVELSGLPRVTSHSSIGYIVLLF